MSNPNRSMTTFPLANPRCRAAASHSAWVYIYALQYPVVNGAAASLRCPGGHVLMQAVLEFAPVLFNLKRPAGHGVGGEGGVDGSVGSGVGGLGVGPGSVGSGVGGLGVGPGGLGVGSANADAHADAPTTRAMATLRAMMSHRASGQCETVPNIGTVSQIFAWGAFWELV